MESRDIVFFSSRCSPFFGGVETHVENICRELINEGDYKVTVVSSAPSQDDGEKCAISVGYKFIDTSKAKTFISRIIKGGSYQILKYGIGADVVHFHDYSTVVGTGFFTFLSRKILRKKLYITFHGWEGVYPPRRRVINLRRIISKLCNGSIQVGKYIEKWYGTHASSTIIGGVNIRPDETEVINGTKFTNKDCFFVGRLDTDTGALEVVEAWIKILKGKNQDGGRLILFGDGPMLSDLRKLTGKFEKASDRTIFCGFKKDPLRFIPSGSIVFTSGYLGILESFAKRCRVISYYDHQLKKDYLHSIEGWEDLMCCAGSIDELVLSYQQSLSSNGKIENAFGLAKSMSWTNIKDQYLTLWGFSY